MRMPTREEMRSMSWQAIAGGANGLIYFHFKDLRYNGATKEENERRWADICAVAWEVKKHEAVLLAEPGPAVEEVPEGLVCRTWRTSDGKVRVLAVNTGYAPVAGKVELEGLPPIAVSLGGLGFSFLPVGPHQTDGKARVTEK